MSLLLLLGALSGALTTVTGMGGGVLLLLVLMIEFTPLGYVAGGARNWLNLGFIRIQPSEFMKLGLVLALARWYHSHTAQEARWSWKLLSSRPA